jgi:hypothetical protein
MRIVASIEEPNAICAILGHFAKHGALEEAHNRPRPRGPPAADNASKQSSDAATIPQGRAWPTTGIQ